MGKEGRRLTEKIRKVAMPLACGTALGTDHTPFREIAILPDTALDQLGTIFLDSIMWLTLPIQTLLNKLAFLGEKSKVVAAP